MKKWKKKKKRMKNMIKTKKENTVFEKNIEKQIISKKTLTNLKKVEKWRFLNIIFYTFSIFTFVLERIGQEKKREQKLKGKSFFQIN